MDIETSVNPATFPLQTDQTDIALFFTGLDSPTAMHCVFFLWYLFGGEQVFTDAVFERIGLSGSRRF
jgi:hypothetical protein